jgi:hypothetical protein
MFIMDYNLYYIGSSVCTSLVEGESMLHPKGMGLLEIKLKKFRLLSIPFTQIRPFIYSDFSLKDVKGRPLMKCSLWAFRISCIETHHL